jgi:hypothetical protein
MKRKLGLAAALVAALLLIVVVSACRQGKTYRADRFDVDILVQENGSATVTETVTLAFRGGPFTYAFREIPTGRTDGIGRLAVYEDGRPCAVGQGPGQYEAKVKGNALRVTWHFAPTENMARTFVLTYQVRGLIRQEGPQDALRWAAIPAQHDYGITQAQVVVRLPGGVGPLGGARVLQGHAQPGILGRQVSFLADEIEPNEPLAIGIWFPHGQLQGVPPAWQQKQMEQASYSPLWIGLASIVLVLGLAGVGWSWWRHGRRRVAARVGATEVPPGDLAPGLAAALLHNGASLACAVATLFDLARRGVLAIEEQAATGGGRQRARFALRLLALPQHLQPFEELTLQVAFREAPPPGSKPAGKRPDRAALGILLAEGWPVSLKEAAAGLRAGRRQLIQAHDAELYERGLFARERDRIRRRFFAAGAGALVAAGLSVAVPVGWGGLFGPWPLLVTAALATTGILALAAGGATSRWTVAGEEAAAQWRAFERYLRQLERGPAQPDRAELLARYLAYALAFGRGDHWARRMAAADAPPPPWFQALSEEADRDARSAAFVALVAAASATGSSGAAAAAGGAAGGGASGAG